MPKPRREGREPAPCKAPSVRRYVPGFSLRGPADVDGHDRHRRKYLLTLGCEFQLVYPPPPPPPKRGDTVGFGVRELVAGQKTHSRAILVTLPY